MKKNKYRVPLWIVLIIALIALNIQAVFSISLHEGQGYTFYHHVLVIKTRSAATIAPSGTSFTEARLQRPFDKLHITRIGQPYAYFNGEKLKARDTRGLARIYEIYYSDDPDPLELANSILPDEAIEYACPLVRPQPCVLPNDSLTGQEYFLGRIDAERAWAISTGDSSLSVAIVDTECDWEHEDLAANIWQNPGECGLDSLGRDKRTNGADDDGNGKIDDWHGWDFCSDMTYNDFINGTIKEDNDTKIRDTASHNNHGTFVASDAAAVTNNVHGLASIGYNTKIMATKAWSDNGDVTRTNEAIVYAAVMGASVINCSWTGIGVTQADRDIINTAAALGAVIVAASGNYFSPVDDYANFYYNYGEIVFAGASNPGDSVSSFSNYGTLVTVYAPGTQVYAAVPYNKYFKFDGTSLSAPIVSGIAALVRSIHPDWTPRQIRHQLRSCSDDVLNPSQPGNRYLFYGRANAYKALSYNRTFSAAPMLPGIEIDSVALLNSIDTIDTYRPVKVLLRVKNYLAPAAGLLLQFRSLDSLVDVPNDVQIPLLGTLADTTVFIDLQLSRLAKWYDKLSKMLVTYTSGDYTDYQLIHFQIKPPPDLTLITNVQPQANNRLADAGIWMLRACSSPDINTLWLIGNDSLSGVVFSIAGPLGINKSGRFADSSLVRPDAICALSASGALAVIEDNTGHGFLYKTANNGDAWRRIDLAGDVYNIVNLAFGDPMNGFMVVNRMTAPYYVVMITNDGGETWRLAPGNPEIKDYPYDMTVAANQDYFWFTTLIGCLYFSSDRGSSWTQSCTADSAARLRLEFQKSCSGVSVGTAGYFSNVYQLETTSDCGASWSAAGSMPLNSFMGFPEIIHATGDHSSIIVADNMSVYVTENLGASWSPVIIADTAHIAGATLADYYSIATEGRKTRLWMVNDRVTYIDFDNLIDAPAPVSSGEMLLYHNIYPNPDASGNVKLQLWLMRRAGVSIRLFNSLGSESKIIFEGELPPDEYSTIYFSTAGLASGLYFCEISVGGRTFTDPLVIVN